MFLRVDKLQIELPKPKEGDPNAASAVQELLGGRFGEMSTLMNYMYQSFNFREKKKLKPDYDLIANISAEELGHIELVSATVNALLEKAAPKKPPRETPFKAVKTLETPITLLRLNKPPSSGNLMGNRGKAITCLTAETSCWTCCTTSSWKSVPALRKCAYIK